MLIRLVVLYDVDIACGVRYEDTYVRRMTSSGLSCIIAIVYSNTESSRGSILLNKSRFYEYFCNNQNWYNNEEGHIPDMKRKIYTDNTLTSINVSSSVKQEVPTIYKYSLHLTELRIL